LSCFFIIGSITVVLYDVSSIISFSIFDNFILYSSSVISVFVVGFPIVASGVNFVSSGFDWSGNISFA